MITLLLFDLFKVFIIVISQCSNRGSAKSTCFILLIKSNMIHTKLHKLHNIDISLLGCIS